MLFLGCKVIEDYFYQDYLKVRHTIKLSKNEQFIYVTNKGNAITLVSSKTYTPLIKKIYNELSLDLLLNESIIDPPVFFSTFLYKKYKHMLK